MDALRDVLANNTAAAKGFALLYVVTFVPAWLIIFYIGKQLASYKSERKRSTLRRISAAVLVEALVLIAPYLYLLIFLRNIPESLKVAGYIILLAATWTLLRKLRRKHQIND